MAIGQLQACYWNGNWKRYSNNVFRFHLVDQMHRVIMVHASNLFIPIDIQPIKITLFSRFKFYNFSVYRLLQTPRNSKSHIYFFVIQPAQKPNSIFELSCLLKTERKRENEKIGVRCLFTLAMPE